MSFPISFDFTGFADSGITLKFCIHVGGRIHKCVNIVIHIRMIAVST